MTTGRFGVRCLLWLGELHRRMLAVYFALLGPRAAYAITGTLARWLYRLLTPVRLRSEAQCRAALGAQVHPEQIPRLAEQAFVHRVWNLTDLLLAERRLHPGTYARYGGRVPEPHLSELLDAQRRGQPAILVSAYYGPFDLLPVFLSYNGIRAAAVYLPHANAAFDAFRRRVRARGGCELIPVEQVLERVPQILVGGGTIALVADHPAARRGLPVTFLGLPTQAPRTVGWLAWRYDADVVVAGIRRTRRPFHFAIEVADVIKHAAWANQADPVAYITERYLRGLERLILRDPTQYLWAYARWGEELAQQLTSESTIPPGAAAL
jgi:KDO2-lipid IV(A) lauroyltransferase